MAIFGLVSKKGKGKKKIPKKIKVNKKAKKKAKGCEFC